MNTSTPLFSPQVPPQMHWQSQHILSSWLKNTQLRFGHKLYTYTPKLHPPQPKAQTSILTNSEDAYQDPTFGKLAQTVTLDNHPQTKVQDLQEKDSQKISPEAEASNLPSLEDKKEDLPIAQSAQTLNYHDIHLENKIQAQLEQESSKGQLQISNADEGEVNKLQESEASVARAIEVLVTPLKPKKQKFMLKKTQMKEQTSSDEEYTLKKQRKKPKKLSKKKAKKVRKQRKRQQTKCLATRLFKND